MVVHGERRKGTWATPLAIFIMTTVTIYVGYSADRELRHIDGQFDTVHSDILQLSQDSKEGTDKLWSAFTDFKHCENQAMVNCCKNATVC